MTRILAALGLATVGAAFVAWRQSRKASFRPSLSPLSPETVADLIRRHDTAGLGEVNDKDPHPFVVEPGGMRVMRQDRPGVDARFVRGRR